MNKKIIIVSSGTGGHVVPAINISETLLKKKYKITWIGTKTGIENKLIKNADIKLVHINSSGIRGKNIFLKIKGAFNFLSSLINSLLILRKEKPLFVIGFGGYISTSVSLSSYLCRIPVYLHESNSIPGTANRINHLLSKKSFQTFPHTFEQSKKVILTGNPIKKSFNNIEGPLVKYNHNHGKVNMLIFGGSQGAKFFNENIPYCLSKINADLSVIHICGKDNKEPVKAVYDSCGIKSEVLEFSYEMNKLYDWSDLIISRSGSMTLSEISASGRASILVPYLYATDNHQYSNAKYLEKNDAAVIIEQNEIFNDSMISIINHLVQDKAEMCDMALNIKSLFPHDSDDIILENIIELNEKHNNSTLKE